MSSTAPVGVTGSLQQGRPRAGRVESDGAALATLIIVDKRNTIRSCLASWVSSELADLTVLDVGSLEELAEDAVTDPGMVIVLLSSAAGPGRDPNAERAARSARERFAEARLVFLCDEMDSSSVAAAIRCGAVGFVGSSSDAAVLAHCLRFVRVGGTALPSVPAPSAGGPTPRATDGDGATERYSRFSAQLFTAKELDVLRCLSAGKPNKIIAYEMSICETTVKVHMRHIMQKLGAKNRTHAALLASDMLT
jgi:DNA-binding NarL/FixJ family response regulator